MTATSAADTTKSASASVTASQASQVSVSVSPMAVSMNQGAQQQFTAIVAGTSNTGVNWSLISGSGTVSSSGLFTAPNQQESDTVQAQSQADTTKTARATVTVPAVGINISPTSVNVPEKGTQQFRAIVTGTVNTAVSWSETGNGTVSQAGLYTAPAMIENDTVKATSLTNSLVSSIASVTVQNQSGTACGNTLTSANPACQIIGAGSLNPWWTVISRHGEYGQGETECNIPQMVTQSPGLLQIWTYFQAYTCGAFNDDGTVLRTPQSWPYSTGDIQWTSLNFTYGTVISSIRLPDYHSFVWPSLWFMDSLCQVENIYSGDPDSVTCPSYNTPTYRELDQVEAIPFGSTGGGWWETNVHTGTSNPGCGWNQNPIDTNFHTVQMIWQPGSITQTIDGVDNGCSFSGSSVPSGPLFAIFQTQTADDPGPPVNSTLPVYVGMQFLKVCTTTDGSCASIPVAAPCAGNCSDPRVIFYDDFQ